MELFFYVRAPKALVICEPCKDEKQGWNMQDQVA